MQQDDDLSSLVKSLDQLPNLLAPSLGNGSAVRVYLDFGNCSCHHVSSEKKEVPQIYVLFTKF